MPSSWAAATRSGNFNQPRHEVTRHEATRLRHAIGEAVLAARRDHVPRAELAAEYACCALVRILDERPALRTRSDSSTHGTTIADARTNPGEDPPERILLLEHRMV
jgi:hypothetical protein